MKPPARVFSSGECPESSEKRFPISLLSKKGMKSSPWFCWTIQTGWAAEDIVAFDYDAVFAAFEQPLELRKIAYTEFPLFGFLFTETRADQTAELDRILYDDLRQFTQKRTERHPVRAVLKINKSRGSSHR
jgi:hypothetical protein